VGNAFVGATVRYSPPCASVLRGFTRPVLGDLKVSRAMISLWGVYFGKALKAPARVNECNGDFSPVTGARARMSLCDRVFTL